MTVSTHVLDAVSGSPAAGLRVALARRAGDGTGWTAVVSAVTDAGGRVRDLAGPLGTGVYQLTFETGEYLRGETFYPQVAVIFEIRDAEQHYHVPLLLSPFAYSTYRGS